MRKLCHRRWAWTCLLGVLLTAALGCDPAVDGPGGVEPDDDSLRIVSLSPALTQILVDLDQGRYIVGVGQNDAAAPAGAAVVGTYLDVNAEMLVRLRPTLVLTMSGRDGPPARLTELAADRFILVDYPYPQSPADVGDLIFRESEMSVGLPAPQPGQSPDDAPSAGPPSIGALLDMLPQAMKLKYTMLVRLGELGKLTKDQGSPSVLMVIGSNPVMAAGPGTVLDQLLAMAGGRNVAAGATVSAPTFDREKLLELKPDVVLFFDPDGHPLGPVETEPRLAEFRGLDIPAVNNQRIVLVNDSLAMLPSSSLDRIAGIMAKALHPELIQQIDPILQASMVELTRKSDIDAVSPGRTQDIPVAP